MNTNNSIIHEIDKKYYEYFKCEKKLDNTDNYLETYGLVHPYSLERPTQ